MSFRGTIKPKANFDDGNAADELENAMKGRGCDKQKIVEMMTGINNAQRQMVRRIHFPYLRFLQLERWMAYR